jgi:hypothetical protein
MEVQAVTHAARELELIWKELSGWPAATIFIKNQATVKALNKHEIATPEGADARQALNAAGLLGNITLRWIKAHNGYAGNEDADILAKEGTAKSFTPQDFGGCRISRGTCKGVIKAHIQARWEYLWYKGTNCRQTRIFFKEPDINTSKALMKTSRENYGRVIRYVTGHNHLKRHNFLLGGHGNNACRHCESAPESIVTSCEAFCTERSDSFANYWLDPQSPTWNVTGLLKFLS